MLCEFLIALLVGTVMVMIVKLQDYSHRLDELDAIVDELLAEEQTEPLTPIRRMSKREFFNIEVDE